MNWFKRVVGNYARLAKKSLTLESPVSEGQWESCPNCTTLLYRARLKEELYVCPNCQHHLPMSARERIHTFVDEGSFEEVGANLQTTDPLQFRDLKRYDQRLKSAKEGSGENEALVAGSARLKDLSIHVAVFEFRFMGGSMGSVVGERFVRAAERSLQTRSPLVVFCASGGARMQESLFSLMQMARTSAVIGRLHEAKIPYVSVLTNPTYGGVSASLAMLGDLNIAEPGAMIGFAGPRVIEQTVREKLPEDFQTSEFLLKHGAVDTIIPRAELRDRIANLLKMLV